MLATIALWWCYLTGGALAATLTAVSYVMAFNWIARATRLTARVVEYQLAKQRGEILSTKSYRGSVGCDLRTVQEAREELGGG